jgi:predicted dehydrogenase
VSVGVGLVGAGGHQLTPAEAHGARLVGTAGGSETAGVPTHVSVASLVRDPAVQLVSVCQEPRHRQVDSAIQALAAGRHVLLERPAATSLADLDRLQEAAHRSGRILCERVTTPFDQPFRLARELVAAGAVGRVVQVLMHKSYPYASWRAQDELVQGGLVLQAAVYGLDCVQHVAGSVIESLHVIDTTLGNPGTGALRMAANLVATLRGGGIATVAASYLNPADSGAWGRDELLVLGTAGRLRTGSERLDVEVVRAGRTTVHEAGRGRSLFAELLLAIGERREMTIAPEDLLRSTRWAVRALQSEDPLATRVSWVEGRWER